MEYLKFKCDRAQIEIIADYYNAKIINDPKRPYDLFQVNTHDSIQIKGYKTSNKDIYTVLFQGKDEKVLSEARIFFKNSPAPKIVETRSTSAWEDTNEQIGSDEVGVGDFFLGFYVCACYITPSDLPLLTELGVKDSKKLTDTKMEEMGPLLLKQVKKETVRVSPDKLDALLNKGFSTHKVLALAHNTAHVNLMKKYHLSNQTIVYIDQFEKEGIYRHYVGAQMIHNPVVFRTKGETYFPSVACASILARYAFLEDWKKMEEKFGMVIPKGAGKDADSAYITLCKKYGKSVIDPYVKRFFRNYKNPEAK